MAVAMMLASAWCLSRSQLAAHSDLYFEQERGDIRVENGSEGRTAVLNSFLSVNDTVPPRGGRIFFRWERQAPARHPVSYHLQQPLQHRQPQENPEKMCILNGLHLIRKGINRGFEPCPAWWQLEQQCEELPVG